MPSRGGSRPLLRCRRWLAGGHRVRVDSPHLCRGRTRVYAAACPSWGSGSELGGESMSPLAGGSARTACVGPSLKLSGVHGRQFLTPHTVPSDSFKVTCRPQPALAFRKDIGRGGVGVAGLHEVQAPRPGWCHLAQHGGRLGGPVDFGVHGLGGRQEWQAARRRQSWRHQGH